MKSMIRARRHKQTRRQRTRKHAGGKSTTTSSSSLPAFESEITHKFLEMLNTIKLFHWKTYSYATHKATDDLYAKLGDNIDKFIEILLGKAQNRIQFKPRNIYLKDITNPQEFKREIESYKSYLVGLNNHKGLKTMSNTDLFNIRDEILGDLNQFLYLYTLK